MFGTIALGVALFFALFAAIAFCVRGNGYARYGRVCITLSFLSTLAASVYLMMAIFENRFDLAYVASYSSRELSSFYKFSAFWAGQQGSFLLWLFIHAAAGVILARHIGEARANDAEANEKGMGRYGIAVYMTLQALLTVLVLAKSPFVPAEAGVQNGTGLNPLLQDPWMAFHPPIIFIGYALFAVPFAYAAGALLSGASAKTWLESARKWGLVAWSFLGAGIFMGGYWAYKVLGWGGYWGWDPVENSSLVPWLLAAAFLHILRVARVREAAVSVLHLSIIFTYALVIYGTFLTRSGILGDFSVHSFSGTSIGLTLAVANALVLVAGLVLLAAKANTLPKGEVYPSHSSREFVMLLGAMILVFITAIIFIGMSMPLLSQLVGNPAAVDTAFYVRTTMPLAIVLMLVMAFASMRCYGAEGKLPKTILPSVLLGIGVFVTLTTGIREVMPVVLAAVSMFAAGASVVSFRARTIGLGALISHVGVGLSFVAMVLAGTGSQSASMEFTPNEPTEVLGHTITYRGQEFEEDGTAKYYTYEVDGVTVQAMTKLHKNGEDAAREPAIAKTLGGDIYIAPTPPKKAGVMEITLKQGKFEMDDFFAYRYEGVTMEPQGGNTLVTADIAVTDGETVEHARPAILATADGGTSSPIEVFSGKKRIRLTGISGDDRMARLEVLPSIEEESMQPVTASVSTKPYIWLLWLGTVVVTVGTLVAIKK